jgi:hypothetical protein
VSGTQGRENLENVLGCFVTLLAAIVGQTNDKAGKDFEVSGRGLIYYIIGGTR